MEVSKGNAIPVEQHFEYDLVVKIVKERAHAGRTSSTRIFSVVVSLGWLGDEFVLG